MTKQFTVAIIGGGIGGLTLAAGLLKRNIPVTIYEAAPLFQEVGLGLSIGPAAHRALPLIEPALRRIYDSLITTHADSPGFERFRETWCEVVTPDDQVLMELKARPSGQTTVRRADFLDALVALIPPERAVFGKRLVRLVEGTGEKEEVRLEFEDGTTAHADVVVGCDGIRSTVKRFILSEEEHARANPRYSGMYGYRAVLDMPDMIAAVGEHRARVTTLYLGKGVYGVSYPIARAQQANVGLYVLREGWEGEEWVRPAGKGDMRGDLAHMGGFVQGLIDHMPDAQQWAIFEHSSISTYARSRVAILGDAAHASTPHMGAGAGQAIEDAHVLVELLGDPRVTHARDVVAAFKAYDAVRRPRSQRVVTSSKEQADLLCLSLDGVGGNEDKLRAAFEERLRWLWDGDVEAEVERARDIMGDIISKEGL